MKKRFPILGKTRKSSFYYWALFSYRLLRSFKTIKSYFFGFKFTQFYFTPSIRQIYKKKTIKYKTLIKRKLNFLKKRGDIRRFVLFRTGSYAWKRFIFRRKIYKHFFNYRYCIKSNIKKTSKLNIYANYLGKKSRFKVKSMYSKKIKRIKRPLNIKHKFNRLFYTNRSIFQKLFHRKHLTQKHFNSTFSFLFKKNYKLLIKSFNFSIVNILIRSRLVFTRAQANFLILNRFVFINGKSVDTTNTYSSIGSVIQIIIHKSYYFFFKRMLSNLRILKKKTGYRVWLLTRFLFNFYKQSPTNVPKWVDKLMYYRLDVPKYIEVDYTVLTVIILYTPKYIYETDIYTFKYINYFLLRLYSWKYII